MLSFKVQWKRLSGVLVLVASDCVFSQNPTGDVGPQNTAATNDVVTTRSEDSSVVLTIPSPIAETDLDRYARLLILSEAQEAFLRSNYDRYRVAVEDLDREYRSRLLGLSQEVAVAFQAGFSPDAATRYEQLLDLEHQVTERQMQLDAEFFGHVKSVLSTTQLPLLERVTQSRRREQSFPLYLLLPAAQIDLSTFLEAFQLEPESRSQIDVMLIDYEQHITPMFVNLRESIDEHALAKVWGVVRAKYDPQGIQYAADSAIAAANAREYFQMNESILAHQSTLQERIAELNERVLGQMLEVLADPERSIVSDAFNARAYPDVYPDSLDPVDVYRKLASADNLSEIHQGALAAVWTAYRAQYDVQCRLMVESYKKWREQLTRTETQGNAGRYQLQMRESQTERWDLSKTVLLQMQETLRDELSPQQLEMIQSQLDRMAKLREYVN